MSVAMSVAYIISLRCIIAVIAGGTCCQNAMKSVEA